jgi:hypothetical protein
VKIEHAVYQSAKMFGRHFDEKDELVSHITRQSIDVLKATFKADVSMEEWQLIKALKPVRGRRRTRTHVHHADGVVYRGSAFSERSLAKAQFHPRSSLHIRHVSSLVLHPFEPDPCFFPCTLCILSHSIALNDSAPERTVFGTERTGCLARSPPSPSVAAVLSEGEPHSSLPGGFGCRELPRSSESATKVADKRYPIMGVLRRRLVSRAVLQPTLRSAGNIELHAISRSDRSHLCRVFYTSERLSISFQARGQLRIRATE